MFNNNQEFSIHAFQQGDPNAFNFIFSVYYPPLCFFAGKLIADRLIAEDIAQEAFVRLWQKHESFDCQEAIKAFLYVITRNACLNFLKHCKRKKKNEQTWAHTWDETEDYVLNKLTRHEKMNEVYTAVNTLPPECRKVILLSYVDGFRNNEIAEKLDISVHTVKNQKTRGLSLLKKRMQGA